MIVFPTLPQELRGTAIYFAALESTPKEVNTAEKLEKLGCFAKGALAEAQSLLKYSRKAGPTRAGNLAAEMSERWEDLAQLIQNRKHEIAEVLAEVGHG